MPGLGLGLDLVVIVMLGVTIFYAVRLSRHLDSFRSNRSDMERLIRELSSQITRAQEGITTLDELSKGAEEDLRRLISKAQGLSDELQLITDAGNSLAGRLETLATKNRSVIDELGQTAVNMVYPGSKPVSAPRKSEERDVRTPLGSPFSIRDPDFEEDADADESGAAESRAQESGEYSSQAERDLAEALLRRKPQR